MNDIFSRRNFLKSSGFGIGALALGSLAPEAVFAATKDSLKNNSDFDSFARSFMYHIPTRLYFGFGELDNLGKYRLPGKKACVVISGGGAMRRYGYLARTEKQLDQAGVQHVLYDKVFPNPTLNQVMGGIDFAKKNGCDFILGLGGGSTMDSAKAIAFGCTNPGNLWDYSSSMTGGNKERVADPLPIVCITTTAGTGSEIDPWGVITKEQTNEKSGFFSGESMYPVLSIVDPGLTFTVPQDYTAYQGMDAFFHASESVINTKNSQMGEMYALLAITLVAKYLPRAVRTGRPAPSSPSPTRWPATTCAAPQPTPLSTPWAASIRNSLTEPASSCWRTLITPFSRTAKPAKDRWSKWRRPWACRTRARGRTSSGPSTASWRSAASRISGCPTTASRRMNSADIPPSPAK